MRIYYAFLLVFFFAIEPLLHTAVMNSAFCVSCFGFDIPTLLPPYIPVSLYPNLPISQSFYVPIFNTPIFLCPIFPYRNLPISQSPHIPIFVYTLGRDLNDSLHPNFINSLRPDLTNSLCPNLTNFL